MSFAILRLVAGAAALGPIAAWAQTVSDPSLSVTAYVTGLSAPTQIRFLGVDDLFVTEKDTGRVQRVQNGVIVSTPLDLNVANDSERGLLGLELDPNFSSNGFVYAYYSATSGGDGGQWLENRLSRFTWDGSVLGSESVLRAFGRAGDGLAGGPNHNAGPLLFGPDGLLYGTTGDLNRFEAEQNNQSAADISGSVGGIYRLEASGSIPSSNPFTSAPNAAFHQWFAYGVRNTYGIAFDPVTGNLWDSENGPTAYDEINLVAPGFNSGWSQIMGPNERDPQDITDLVNLPGSAYSDPEFSFLQPVGVTGLTFLAGSALGPAYHGSLIVGDINFGNLYRFELNAARDGFALGGDLADLVADNEAERNAVLWGHGFANVTDLQVGPDGALYVTSFGNGAVYRVVPEPSTALLAGLGGGYALARRRRA